MKIERRCLCSVLSACCKIGVIPVWLIMVAIKEACVWSAFFDGLPVWARIDLVESVVVPVELGRTCTKNCKAWEFWRYEKQQYKIYGDCTREVSGTIETGTLLGGSACRQTTTIVTCLSPRSIKKTFRQHHHQLHSVDELHFFLLSAQVKPHFTVSTQ